MVQQCSTSHFFLPFTKVLRKIIPWGNWGPGGMPVTTDTVVVPAKQKKVAKIKSMPVGSEGFFWLNFSTLGFFLVEFLQVLWLSRWFQDGFEMMNSNTSWFFSSENWLLPSPMDFHHLPYSLMAILKNRTLTPSSHSTTPAILKGWLVGSVGFDQLSWCK